MKKLFSILVFAVAGMAQVTKPTVARPSVEGIANLARIETTVACSGAIKPGSVAAIHKMGFVAIINLRLPTEPGAGIDDEAAAAKAAGIRFFSLPFDGAKPDPAVVDRFLTVIAEPGVQPAFIHCSGGNRAAMMWFVKRVLIDKWDTDRATEEATQLGLTSATLKAFALDYIKAHKK